MIAGTYLISATVLAISGYLFWIGALTAITQTILWCVVFFAVDRRRARAVAVRPAGRGRDEAHPAVHRKRDRLTPHDDATGAPA
jgi:hypothetical protein